MKMKGLFALLLVLTLAMTMVLTVCATTSNGGGMFLSLLALKQNFRYYDGDTLVARQRIVRGEINEALTLEDKDGLTLEGWYTDKELTEKYDFSKPVETGAVLYAKWVDASEVVTPEDTTEDAVEDTTEETETPVEETTEDTTEVTE